MGLFKPNIKKLEANKDTNAIIKLIDKTPNKTLSIQALLALANIGDLSTVPYIAKFLAKEEILLKYCAILALGKIGDPKAIEYLHKELDTKDKILKTCILLSLGVLGQTDSVDLIIKELNTDNEYLRGFAALSLGRIGASKAIKEIINCCNTEDEFLNECLVFSLYYFNKSAVDEIIKSLSSKNRNVLYVLIEALSKIGDSIATKPLEKLLKHKDDFVRCLTTDALGNIGDSNAVDALIEILDDKDDMVKYGSAEALGKIRNEKAINPLIKLLGNEDRYSSVSYSVVNSLIQFNNTRIKELLIKEFEEIESTIEKIDDFENELKDHEVRRAKHIAIYLAKIGISEGWKYLITKLKNKYIDMRYNGNRENREEVLSLITGLGETKRPESSNVLFSLTSDKEGSIKYSAACALEKIGKSGAEIIIAGDLEVNEEEAISYLGFILEDGNAKALKYLIKRKCGADAISRIPPNIKNKDMVMQQLLAALKFEEGLYKKAVIKALSNLNDLNSLVPLIMVLEDKDETVGFYALKAISKILLGYFIENKEVKKDKTEDCFHNFIWQGDLTSENRYKVCIKCGYIEYPK